MFNKLFIILFLIFASFILLNSQVIMFKNKTGDNLFLNMQMLEYSQVDNAYSYRSAPRSDCDIGLLEPNDILLINYSLDSENHCFYKNIRFIFVHKFRKAVVFLSHLLSNFYYNKINFVYGYQIKLNDNILYLESFDFNGKDYYLTGIIKPVCYSCQY